MSNTALHVTVKRLSPTAKIPTYANPGDACFDLYADIHADPSKYHTDPWGANTVVVGTGLAFAVPPGHAMLVFSRSGQGFKENTRLANCVGVIDSGYRGEVKVKLTRDDWHPIKVSQGERIAQALILPVQQVRFFELDDLGDTERGEGGFGSSGK